MPLDYAIWKAIDDRMDESAPDDAVTETKADYLNRLGHTARTLPWGFGSKVVARMKKNIQGTIDACGTTRRTIEHECAARA